jgi:cytochrome c553
MKRPLFFVLGALLLNASMAFAQTPAGDPTAGKALWDGATTSCKNCHGDNAEGGFGPDLAGRKLTFAQFTHAVQKPWGVMPAFLQLNVKQIADLYAYVSNLPGVPEPGPWKFTLPADAPRGQVLALSTGGCVMCHSPILNIPRRGIAEANGDFEWFKHMVYDHVTAMPEHCVAVGPDNNFCRAIRMGNYSRTRLREDQLREIYDWAVGLGLDSPIEGTISDAVPAGAGETYALTVTNKGVEADTATIALVIPSGANVVTATGTGYKGVRMDNQAKTNVAEWAVPKIGPNDKQAYSITLSRAATAAEKLHGTIRWVTRGGRPAGPKDFAEIRVKENKPDEARGGGVAPTR